VLPSILLAQGAPATAVFLHSFLFFIYSLLSRLSHDVCAMCVCSLSRTDSQKSVSIRPRFEQQASELGKNFSFQHLPPASSYYHIKSKRREDEKMDVGKNGHKFCVWQCVLIANSFESAYQYWSVCANGYYQNR
jgi:hypothetical protein